MAIALTPEEEAILRAILAGILPPDIKVYAFGSRAGGTPKPWSDLDLVLEGDGLLPLALLAALAEAFDESPLPWKVDLVDRACVTPEFGQLIDQSKVAFA